jgi:hypothetical protein
MAIYVQPDRREQLLRSGHGKRIAHALPVLRKEDPCIPKPVRLSAPVTMICRTASTKTAVAGRRMVRGKHTLRARADSAANNVAVAERFTSLVKPTSCVLENLPIIAMIALCMQGSNRTSGTHAT